MGKVFNIQNYFGNPFILSRFLLNLKPCVAQSNANLFTSFTIITCCMCYIDHSNYSVVYVNTPLTSSYPFTNQNIFYFQSVK